MSSAAGLVTGAAYDRGVPPSSRRPTATFWLDESGTKATAARCYVVAGIKTRKPDELERNIQTVRDRHSYHGELKFGRLDAKSLPIFRDLVEVLEESDAHLVGTVVDANANPFHRNSVWDAYTEVVTQLVVGNLNRREFGCVFVDRITTPPSVNLGGLIKRRLNGRLSGSPVLLATSLNSKSSDLLQAADLVAGAIRAQRMVTTDKPEKVRIINQLALAFGATDLRDARLSRLNIQTLRTTSRR